jgi:hypothetical protein
MRILKKGNSVEHGAASWDPYRNGQIIALDRVRNIAAKFAHHRNDSNWETLTQRRKIAHMYALFEAYTGEGLGRLWVIDYKDHAEQDRS